jgi:2-polyprenyl-3-methyl-5-hydroxy-6-metoxy-1,4-benzoquinol methylase
MNLFEEIYERADGDASKVPWGHLAPRPVVVDWLDRQRSHGGRALVIACGLGDDAEELARRGYAVEAFDVVERAIEWCRERFPDSSVSYRVADLFDLPAEWLEAFDLVVEVQTIQSLPMAGRREAIEAIAATVAPGGRVLVRAHERAEGEEPDGPPWPLTQSELRIFSEIGLREAEFGHFDDAMHAVFVRDA